MRQAYTHGFGAERTLESHTWRTDESDMINALMSAAWDDHHMNRRARVKLFMRGMFRKGLRMS